MTTNNSALILRSWQQSVEQRNNRYSTIFRGFEDDEIFVPNRPKKRRVLLFTPPLYNALRRLKYREERLAEATAKTTQRTRSLPITRNSFVNCLRSQLSSKERS